MISHPENDDDELFVERLEPLTCGYFFELCTVRFTQR